MTDLAIFFAVFLLFFIGLGLIVFGPTKTTSVHVDGDGKWKGEVR